MNDTPTSKTNLQCRFLIGVMSGAGMRQRRDACRATWFTTKQENQIVRFFHAGEMSENPEDTVLLSCPDDYDHLPAKVVAFFQWALDNVEFDYLLKCDDDSYVRLDRLEILLEGRIDSIGCKNPANSDAYSGAGYMLSRTTIQKLLAISKMPTTGPEDVAISKILNTFTKLQYSPLVVHDTSKIPKEWNEHILSHWITPAKMKRIHTEYDIPIQAKAKVKHIHWEDEILFFDNGRYCRKSCQNQWGNYLVNENRITLHWDDWPAEIVMREESSYKSKAMTLNFFWGELQKPMRSEHVATSIVNECDNFRRVYSDGVKTLTICPNGFYFYGEDGWGMYAWDRNAFVTFNKPLLRLRREGEDMVSPDKHFRFLEKYSETINSEENVAVVVIADGKSWEDMAGVAILSADFETKRGIHFILVINSECKKDKTIYALKSLLKQSSAIDFKYLDEFDSIKGFKPKHRSLLLRLFLPWELPEFERIVYIDSDTMVYGDIGDLVTTNLNDHPVGAVIDPYFPIAGSFRAAFPGRNSHYFNAGVFVMDSAKIRKEMSKEQMLVFVKETAYKITGLDQTVLNYVFHRRIEPIHPKFNYPAWKVGDASQDVFFDSTNTNTRVSIMHFVGEAPKAWLRDSTRIHSNTITRKWFNYLRLIAHKSNPDDFMNVIMGVRNVEFEMASVSIASLFHFTKRRIALHIVSDSITEEQMEKFRKMASANAAPLFFVVQRPLLIPEGKQWGRHLTVMFGKHLWTGYIPHLKKMLRMDSDVLFTGDVAKVYDLDFSENRLWAKSEKPAKAHCSGFVLLDAEYERLRFPYSAYLQATLMKYVGNEGDRDEAVVNLFLSDKCDRLPDTLNVVNFDKNMPVKESPPLSLHFYGWPKFSLKFYPEGSMVRKIQEEIMPTHSLMTTLEKPRFKSNPVLVPPIMENESIILYQCHDNFEICAERLKILKRLNPYTPLHILYSGDRNKSEIARSVLECLGDSYFEVLPEKGSSYWHHCEYPWKKWFEQVGRHLPFSHVVHCEWDLLMTKRLDEIFPVIARGVFYASEIKLLDEAIKNGWCWAKSGYEKYPLFE